MSRREEVSQFTGDLFYRGAENYARDNHRAVEVWTPRQRTFWQWLRRKPRRYDYAYFPKVKVRLEEGGGEDDE